MLLPNFLEHGVAAREDLLRTTEGRVTLRQRFYFSAMGE
jgi:hypothetical protein